MNDAAETTVEMERFYLIGGSESKLQQVREDISTVFELVNIITGEEPRLIVQATGTRADLDNLSGQFKERGMNTICFFSDQTSLDTFMETGLELND